MFEYDEYEEKIIDHTPEKYSGKCNCCGTGIYAGETVVKYDGLLYCNTDCVIKQLESDNIIELDFEIGGNENE